MRLEEHPTPRSVEANAAAGGGGAGGDVVRTAALLRYEHLWQDAAVAHMLARMQVHPHPSHSLMGTQSLNDEEAKRACISCWFAARWLRLGFGMGFGMEQRRERSLCHGL